MLTQTHKNVHTHISARTQAHTHTQAEIVHFPRNEVRGLHGM